MKNEILDDPGVKTNLIGQFPAFKFYLIGLASFIVLQILPFCFLSLRVVSISSDGGALAILVLVVLSVCISAPSAALAMLTALFSFGKSKSRHENLVNVSVLILTIISLIAGTFFTIIVWD